eukprot:3561218-Ditylum_brightwellii.AAC.1
MQNAQIKEFVTVRDSRMQLFPWLQRQKACGVGSLLPARDCSEHGTYEFMKDLTPLESFTMNRARACVCDGGWTLASCL